MKIFSHSEDCFTEVMVCFAVQKLFSYVRSNLSIVYLHACAIMNNLSWANVLKYIPYFLIYRTIANANGSLPELDVRPYC